MKKLRGYIFSRSFMGERAPQHVQNIIIRDYCKKNKLSYLLSATEYAMDGCYLMLDNIVKKLKLVDEIIAYNLFQMPPKKKERLRIFNHIIKKKKELHFSVEGIKITKRKDIENIEDIWAVKQTLPDCLDISEIQ